MIAAGGRAEKAFQRFMAAIEDDAQAASLDCAIVSPFLPATAEEIVRGACCRVRLKISEYAGRMTGIHWNGTDERAVCTPGDSLLQLCQNFPQGTCNMAIHFYGYWISKTRVGPLLYVKNVKSFEQPCTFGISPAAYQSWLRISHPATANMFANSCSSKVGHEDCPASPNPSTTHARFLWDDRDTSVHAEMRASSVDDFRKSPPRPIFGSPLRSPISKGYYSPECKRNPSAVTPTVVRSPLNQGQAKYDEGPRTPISIMDTITLPPHLDITGNDFRKVSHQKTRRTLANLAEITASGSPPVRRSLSPYMDQA